MTAAGNYRSAKVIALVRLRQMRNMRSCVFDVKLTASFILRRKRAFGGLDFVLSGLLLSNVLGLRDLDLIDLRRHRPYLVCASWFDAAGKRGTTRCKNKQGDSGKS
jgi:hypothetical protein